MQQLHDPVDLLLDDEVIQHVDSPTLQLQGAYDQAKAVPGATEIGFNIVMVLQPFLIAKPGKLRVRARLDGQELTGNNLRIAFVSGIASFCGYVFFGQSSTTVISFISGLAAGAILAMIVETMIPEAYEKQHDLAGLITVIGFLVAFMTSKLS